MARVDFDSLILSMKVLGILFILTISASSVILLVKLIQLQGAFTVRRLMVIILTAGVLLFSLFPLVVNVRVQFEPSEMTCRTRVLSSVYENFFFPFVYAMGLLALALELSIAKRGSSGPPAELLRLVYVSFPWIFGCVLILPLTMAGVDWDDHCSESFSYTRHRSFVWVCNLLPASAVLTVAIFLAFKIGGDSGDYPNEASMAYSSSTQRVVQSSSSSSSYSGGFQPAGYNSNQQTAPALPSAPPLTPQRPVSSHFQHDHGAIAPPPYQTNVYQVPQHHYNHHHHYNHSNQQHHHHQQHHPKYKRQADNVHQQQHHPQQPPPQYPPPPPPNYAPPPPGFGIPYYDYDHSSAPHHHHHHHHHSHNNHHHHHQQPNHQTIPHSHSFTQPQLTNSSNSNTNTNTSTQTSVPKIRDIRNEAKTFAKIAALFVFCSLPQAIFNLAYLMNEDRVWLDVMSTTVISQLVAWLTVLRWLLLTICWSLCFK